MCKWSCVRVVFYRPIMQQHEWRIVKGMLQGRCWPIPTYCIMPVSGDISILKRRLLFKKSRHTYVAHCTFGNTLWWKGKQEGFTKTRTVIRAWSSNEFNQNLVRIEFVFKDKICFSSKYNLLHLLLGSNIVALSMTQRKFVFFNSYPDRHSVCINLLTFCPFGSETLDFIITNTYGLSVQFLVKLSHSYPVRNKVDLGLTFSLINLTPGSIISGYKGHKFLFLYTVCTVHTWIVSKDKIE